MTPNFLSNLQDRANAYPKLSLILIVILLSACDIFLIRDLASVVTQVQGKRFWVNILLSSFCLLLFLLAVLPIKTKLWRGILLAFLLVPQLIQLSYFATYNNFVSLFDLSFFFQDTRLAFELGAQNTPWLSLLLLVIIELPLFVIMLNLSLKPYRIARVLNGFFALVFFAVLTLSWYSTAKFQYSSVSFWTLVPAMIERFALENDNQIKKPELAYREQAKNDAPNLIYVVGESLNSTNMGIYGYQRNTTPKLNELAQSSKLVAFKNTVSIGTRTMSSVPHMLTGFQSIDPNGQLYSLPTIFNYAKAAGYYTGLITAQELKWRNLDQILVDKDVDVYKNGTSFSTEVDVLSGADDMQVIKQGVLPFIEQAKKTGKPYLLVIQMNGSHYPYNTHSPKEVKQFLPETEPNSLNAYDNTVLYSDLVLSTLFQSLSDPENTWAFYSSDHGQGINKEKSRFNRGFEKQVVFTPILAFSSPSNILKLKHNEHKPVTHVDIFYTLLGLMQMQPATTVTALDLRGHISSNRLRLISRYTKVLHNDPHAAIVLPNRQMIKIDFEKQNALLVDGETLVPYSQLPKEYREFVEGKAFNVDNQIKYKE